jgi:hypothetical protein
MLWLVIGWIVLCWIIGAASCVLIGLGLFFAPIMGGITFAVSKSAAAGWLTAAALIITPIGYYSDKREREEKEKRAKIEAETIKRIEAQERRKVQEDVRKAYEALKEHSDSEEAKQFCKDYEDFYRKDLMETEITFAFEVKIIELARPFIEAKELQEEQEEEARWQEEERQEEAKAS